MNTDKMLESLIRWYVLSSIRVMLTLKSSFLKLNLGMNVQIY